MELYSLYGDFMYVIPFGSQSLWVQVYYTLL